MFVPVIHPVASELYQYLVELEIRRAVRYSSFFSICHISLDQEYQDGAAMQTAADIIQETIRETDVLGRLDGHTFSVLLHNTEIQSAQTVAERIRNRVADQTFIIDHAPMRGTASIGGACFPTHGNDTKMLLLKASEMLEAARRQGGNTIAVPE